MSGCISKKSKISESGGVVPLLGVYWGVRVVVGKGWGVGVNNLSYLLRGAMVYLGKEGFWLIFNK